MKIYSFTISRVIRDRSEVGWRPQYISGGPNSAHNYHTQEEAISALNTFWESLPEAQRPVGDRTSGNFWFSRHGELVYHVREYELVP